MVVGGGSGGDMVVDNPHIAIAEGLDTLELEGTIALLGRALGHAGGLGSLAVAGLAGAEADPPDLALALAHVAGTTHAHGISAGDGELVELELHGGPAGDGVTLGRDLHGHDIGHGVEDGGRGRGELLLLWLLGLGDGRGRRGGHGGGGGSVVAGAGKGQDGVGVVDGILVVVALGLRRVRLEMRLLVLVLVVLMLDLSSQWTLARLWSQSALGSKDRLDSVQALLDVLESLVDTGVDALVDDGGEGIGQCCKQVVGDEETLLGWIRHLFFA